MYLNVQINVIGLGGAHIAFHGLATRVHCSTGLKKHNFGGRSYSVDCTRRKNSKLCGVYKQASPVPKVYPNPNLKPESV